MNARTFIDLSEAAARMSAIQHMPVIDIPLADMREAARAAEIEIAQRTHALSIMRGIVKIREADEKRAKPLGIVEGNLQQYRAFRAAFDTMMDLRRQPGIKTPDGTTVAWHVGYQHVKNEIEYQARFELCGGTVAPAFESMEAAQAAVDAVGELRVMDAFNVLLFMTPHSRAE
jgi:hypothetical protein